MNGKGIPLKGRVYTPLMLWATLTLSCLLAGRLWITLVLMLCGILINLYILTRRTLHAPVPYAPASSQSAIDRADDQSV